MKFYYSSAQPISLNKIFRRKGNLSHKFKSTIKERASYCIHFETGTKGNKIIKFNKISQSSDQTLIEFLEWKELESKRIRQFIEEEDMSKSPSRNMYCFLYDSNEKYFVEIVYLGYGNSFHLLTTEHLHQMTVFEEMVEFDNFYRNPEKCFSSLRLPSMIHKKRKQFVIQGTSKN